MRTVLACILGALVLVLGYGLYWQHRLAPIMDSPTVRLAPEPLALRAPASVRHVDLGYASFDLPARISGEVVQQGDTLFFTITGTAKPREGVTIGPILSDTAPEIRSLVAGIQGMGGWRPRSYWEVEKAALFARPFSVWAIPFRGGRRTMIDAMLLSIKGLIAAGAVSIRFHENDRIGAFVTIRPDLALIRIADKSHGTEQCFMVAPTADVEEIASALVQTYQIRTTDFSEANLLRLAATAGIRHQTLPMAVGPNESPRLQEIVDEVRKRRAAGSTGKGKVE